MKLDAYVHTIYSGYSRIRPLKRVMRESYSSVEGAYRRAKNRGMALVAITDHDSLQGALTIADRPDVIIGCDTWASHICRFATSFYARRTARVFGGPADWRLDAFLACALIGLPLIATPLTVALGPFILEGRFNRGLLLNLVANRSLGIPEVA